MNLNDDTILSLVDMASEFAGGVEGLREISQISEVLDDLSQAVFYYYARDTNFEEGSAIAVEDLLGNKEKLKTAILERVAS